MPPFNHAICRPLTMNSVASIAGAGLFNTEGEVVGMHNSWDADNDGQRHAVSWHHLVGVVAAAVERAKAPL